MIGRNIYLHYLSEQCFSYATVAFGLAEPSMSSV